MAGNLRYLYHFFLLLIMALCGVAAYAQPNIRIYITNEEGVPLKQVAEGQPFILEISIDGIHNNVQPKIHGIKKFLIEKQSMRMSTINGVSTVVHRYTISTDQRGTYRLGPVEIMTDAGSVRSSAITVTVGQEVIEDMTAAAAMRRRERARKAFLQVSTDKNHVVVGEKFHLFVRFMFQERDIALQQIQVPELASLVEQSKSGPKSGKQVVDGVTYDYLEWEWELLARQEGKKKIPAFSAEFVQQMEDDGFGGFHRMFRGLVDRKRVNSAPIFVMVDPLPPFNHEVKAVGSFSQLRASAESSVAREGEGVVYSLELTGEGNMQELDTLPLEGIPAGFKAYHSKSYQVPHEPSKRRFEFILQAVAYGDWKIPAQIVYYFDTVSRSYKQLQSEPVSIAVVAAPGSSKDTNSTLREKHDMPTTSSEPVKQEETLMPLSEEYVTAPAAWKLPWWIFFMGILVPLAVVCCVHARRKVPELLARLVPVWGKKQQWHRLRKQLAYARMQGDLGLVQEIFVTIFAAQCAVTREEVTEEIILEKLKRNHFTRDECQRWQTFWGSVNAALFSSTKQKEVDQSEIFAEALWWLNTYERALIKE